MAFSRKLRDPLLAKLLGIGAPLLDALRALDLRIRDNEINFYSADKSLLKVSQSALVLHYKYAAGCELAGARKSKGGYLSLPFTEQSVTEVLEHLPSILKNVREHAGVEGPWEEALVRANEHGTPLVVLDRQVRRPGDGDQRRLDLVAVTTDEAPMLVAIELKRGDDNRIQEVPEQLHKYLEMLDPDGEGLSADVADAYRIACTQLKSLGRVGPDPRTLTAGMPVRGLLVLADYNPRSTLLARARECARRLPRPMFLWTTAKRDAPVPIPQDWQPLQ